MEISDPTATHLSRDILPTDENVRKSVRFVRQTSIGDRLNQVTGLLAQIDSIWLVAMALFLISTGQISAQSSSTSNGQFNAVVVEIAVAARDDIPINSLEDRSPNNRYPGWIENNKFWLHPEAARQIRWHQSGGSIFFPENIKKLEDIKYVFVERKVFNGTGRRGVYTRIFFSQKFPPFPEFDEPEKVYVGPLAHIGSLMRVIPWPQAHWKMQKDSILEIGTDEGTSKLAPGKEFEFENRIVEIPMRFIRHKPVPVGADSSPAKPLEIAASTGRFEAKVVIAFHGTLAVEVAK